MIKVYCGFIKTSVILLFVVIISAGCLDYLLEFWVILHAFLLSAGFLSKLTFFKNSFRNTIRVSNDQSVLNWVETACKRYIHVYILACLCVLLASLLK